MSFIRNPVIADLVFARDTFEVVPEFKTPCELALETYIASNPNDPNPPSNEGIWENAKSSTTAVFQPFTTDPDRYFVVGNTEAFPVDLLTNLSGNWPVSWPPFDDRGEGFNDVDPFTGPGGLVATITQFQNNNGNVTVGFVVTDRNGSLSFNTTARRITIFQESGFFARSNALDPVEATGVFDVNEGALVVTVDSPSTYVSNSGEALIPVTGIDSPITFNWFTEQDNSIWLPENDATRYDSCPLNPFDPASVFSCPVGTTLVSATVDGLPSEVTYSHTIQGSKEVGETFAGAIVLGGAALLEQLAPGLQSFNPLLQPVPLGARITSFTVTGSGAYNNGPVQDVALTVCPASGPAVPLFYEGATDGQVALLKPFLAEQEFYDDFEFARTIDGSAAPIAVSSQAPEVILKTGTKLDVCNSTPGNDLFVDIPTTEVTTYVSPLGIVPLPEGGALIDADSVFLLQLGVSGTDAWSGEVTLTYTVDYSGTSGSSLFCVLDGIEPVLPRRRVTINGQHVRFFNSYSLIPPGQITLPPQTGGPTPV